MTNESKNCRLLLDTKPLIKLFAKEQGWEAVQNIILQIENGEIDAAISVVTLTEIYYKYLHEKRPDLAKARVEALKYATYIEKIGIDEKIAIKAGDFKGKYRIPISDSLIAATAYYSGAITVTDDDDFKQISEITVLSEKEFLSSKKQR
ncbi:MAG: PIN domain-containing protein [Candidatus Bathyarchaeota archaeon]|nr:PIN domain-containing protein [Candidatus Bathyarchaeota archaeon]